MDVTCERCSTAYEFDETLISDKGTTVKCTNCGHLFRLFRQSAPPATSSGPRPWLLRRRNGEESTFAELATLQQWILDGKVDREDEISRTGEVWKRLGTIAELATFFAAAEAARPQVERVRRKTPAGGFAQPPAHEIGVLPTMRMEKGAASAPGPVLRSPAAATGTSLGGLAATLGPSASSPDVVPPRSFGSAPTEMDPLTSESWIVPSGPPQGQATQSFGIPVEPPRPPPMAYAIPVAPPPPAPPLAPIRTTESYADAPRAIPPTAYGLHGKPTEEVAFPEQGLARGVLASQDSGPLLGVPASFATMEPSGGLGPVRTSALSPAWEAEEPRAAARKTLDVGDSYVPAAPRTGVGKIVGVVVLLGLAGGGFVMRDRLAGIFAGTFGSEGEPTEDRGSPFVNHGLERIGQDTDDALAEAEAELTKALAFRDDDPRALCGLATLAALRATGALDDARDAEAGMARAAGEAGALRARADARRSEATRQIAAAKRHIDLVVAADGAAEETQRALAFVRALEDRIGEARAALTEAGSAAQSAFVRGVIAERESGPASPDASAAYEEAVRQAPHLHRARVRLARILAARGDGAGARAQLDEVLRASPGHGRAKALRDAIERGEPPLPVTVAAAGAPPAAATADPAGPAEPTADREGIPRGEDGAPVAVPAGRGFDFYVEQAEGARENGRCAAAIPFYEQALASRPGASEALAGLGLCQLASGDSNGAVTRFRATLDVNPSYSLAHWGLGEAYRRLGRRQEAIRAYREYLALVPSGGRSGAVRAAIEELEGAAGGGGAAPPPPSTSAPPPPPSGSSDLPAPIGTPGSGTIQQSDTLTEDSEPPLRPGERL